MIEIPTRLVSKRNKPSCSIKPLSSQLVKKKTSMTVPMKDKRIVER